MRLADGAAYLMILARLGPASLAVTSNLSINFLRRARPGDLVATVTLLKLGTSLAHMNVEIHEPDTPDREPIAAALVTYSLTLTNRPHRNLDPLGAAIGGHETT